MAVTKKKKEEHSPIHNCYDPEMRLLIAWRIRDERVKLFPNMGGAKKCAAAFGVSQQQWSLYESGGRTPDDSKLAHIAKLFKVTLAHMKTPPGNWPEVRKRLLRLKKSKELVKLDRLEEIIEPDDEFEAGLETDNGQDTEQENNGQAYAVVESVPFPQPSIVTIGALIDQIIAVDKMHDKGQIPTPVFNFAMESISADLLKLTAGHRSGGER
jgi:transcriptional regulator with XRE-family HTH domain